MAAFSNNFAVYIAALGRDGGLPSSSIAASSYNTDSEWVCRCSQGCQ